MDALIDALLSLQPVETVNALLKPMGVGRVKSGVLLPSKLLRIIASSWHGGVDVRAEGDLGGPRLTAVLGAAHPCLHEPQKTIYVLMVLPFLPPLTVMSSGLNTAIGFGFWV